ncbi:MAG: glycerophosphodiester phosphodiesterase [Spirochaetota bacterium]
MRDCHEKGIAVYVWTANDEKTIRRLLAAGVDGIFSDDAALVKRVCGAAAGE